MVNKSVWADMVLQAQVAPIYWCYNVRSTNILVLLVLAAPIGENTQTFYNLNNFADFLNVCSANILVLTGLQHQYIGAVQGESKCLHHHTYSVKRCLFNQLEQAEVEIEIEIDGGQIKIKMNVAVPLTSACSTCQREKV